MTRLDEFVERRNELAERYDELLADWPALAGAASMRVLGVSPLRGGRSD